MDCPVCQHKNINPLHLHCPNCNADLAALRMIDVLEDDYVEAVKQRISMEGELVQTRQNHQRQLQDRRRRNNRLLLLLLCLPLLQWLLGKRPPPPLVVKEVQQVTMDSDSLAKELKQMQRQLTSLEAQKVRSIQYVIRKGDVLESLGLLFFNDRMAGYQIGKDNGITPQQYLQPGDTLDIHFREL